MKIGRLKINKTGLVIVTEWVKKVKKNEIIDQVLRRITAVEQGLLWDSSYTSPLKQVVLAHKKKIETIDERLKSRETELDSAVLVFDKFETEIKQLQEAMKTMTLVLDGLVKK